MTKVSYHLDKEFQDLAYNQAYLNTHNDASNPVQGEVSLWCAVVEEALRQPKNEVKRWLRSTSFSFILKDLLNINPEPIREIIKKRLKEDSLLIADLRQGAIPHRLLTTQPN